MRKDISWKVEDGGHIHAIEWSPVSKPKYCLTLVHGLGEHIGRYEYFASYFNSKAAIVTALDLRGHGKTDGQRGHVATWETFFSDISTLVERNAHDFAGIPQILYGHSMGGGIALSFVLQTNPNVQGVVVTSPLISTCEPVPPLKLTLAKFMNQIFPGFNMDNGLDRNALSKNSEVIEKYNQDPLVHGKISARLGWNLIENGMFLLKNADRFPLPLLVMIGSNEKIVSLEDARRFASASNKAEFKVWDGLYHELHNEPERDNVLDYAHSWIKSQVEGKSS